MIEKPLMIIIFMYAAGFAPLLVQYFIADPLGIILTNREGVALAPSMQTVLNFANINTFTTNVSNATNAENSTNSAIDNAFQIGYNVGKMLINGGGLTVGMLLTGTYIFQVAYLLLGLGLPGVFLLTPFAILYLFMLARTLIAYIRGV